MKNEKILTERAVVGRILSNAYVLWGMWIPCKKFDRDFFTGAVTKETETIEFFPVEKKPRARSKYFPHKGEHERFKEIRRAFLRNALKLDIELESV
jgi:hypothetical protein